MRDARVGSQHAIDHLEVGRRIFGRLVEAISARPPAIPQIRTRALAAGPVDKDEDLSGVRGRKLASIASTRQRYRSPARARWRAMPAALMTTRQLFEHCGR